MVLLMGWTEYPLYFTLVTKKITDLTNHCFQIGTNYPMNHLEPLADTLPPVKPSAITQLPDMYTSPSPWQLSTSTPTPPTRAVNWQSTCYPSQWLHWQFYCHGTRLSQPVEKVQLYSSSHHWCCFPHVVAQSQDLTERSHLNNQTVASCHLLGYSEYDINTQSAYTFSFPTNTSDLFMSYLIPTPVCKSAPACRNGNNSLVSHPPR